MDQHQFTILIAVVAAIVVIAIVSFLLARKRRSQNLRERFGPEYDRVVKKEGEVRKAEGVLEMRAKRREQFELRPLSAQVRADFTERWRVVQAHFVDDAMPFMSSLYSAAMRMTRNPMALFPGVLPPVTASATKKYPK